MLDKFIIQSTTAKIESIIFEINSFYNNLSMFLPISFIESIKGSKEIFSTHCNELEFSLLRVFSSHLRHCTPQTKSCSYHSLNWNFEPWRLSLPPTQINYETMTLSYLLWSTYSKLSIFYWISNYPNKKIKLEELKLEEPLEYKSIEYIKWMLWTQCL